MKLENHNWSKFAVISLVFGFKMPENLYLFVEATGVILGQYSFGPKSLHIKAE